MLIFKENFPTQYVHECLGMLYVLERTACLYQNAVIWRHAPRGSRELRHFMAAATLKKGT